MQKRGRFAARFVCLYMIISETVSEFVDLLATWSAQGLQDRAMLARLLQHTHDHGRHDQLAAIAFHGAALHRLFGTIRTQSADSEHYPKLEEEFSRLLHELHAMLAEMVSGTDGEFPVQVERHYLTVAESSLRNLLQLASDLAWLKRWELAMTEHERTASDTDTDSATDTDTDAASPAESDTPAPRDT